MLFKKSNTSSKSLESFRLLCFKPNSNRSCINGITEDFLTWSQGFFSNIRHCCCCCVTWFPAVFKGLLKNLKKKTPQNINSNTVRFVGITIINCFLIYSFNKFWVFLKSECLKVQPNTLTTGEWFFFQTTEAFFCTKKEKKHLFFFKLIVHVTWIPVSNIELEWLTSSQALQLSLAYRVLDLGSLVQIPSLALFCLKINDYIVIVMDSLNAVNWPISSVGRV